MVILAAACYQDKSTIASESIPDIVITPSFQLDTLSYPYGETISLSAEAVQEGVPEETLEYTWELDVQPGKYADRAFLSDQKSIEYRILNTPSAMPYYLSLTVKNNESGYAKSMVWPLYVTNSLGEGILVGHTRDHGQTSELDLVAAQSITYGYVNTEPRYARNLFSLGNDTSIEGKVQAIRARSCTNLNAANISSFNEDMIMVGTDKHIYQIDPLTYKVARKDGELFNSGSLSSFNTKFIYVVGNYASCIGIDDQLFVCCDLLDRDYAVSVYPNSKGKGTFQYENTCTAKDDQGDVLVFDQNLHTVSYCKGWSLHSSAFAPMGDDELPAKELLADKTCVAAGCLKNQKAGFVLTDPAGKYYLLIADETNGTQSQIFTLEAPEIDKAVSFAFCDNADLFYYATANGIYANVISGSTLSTKLLSWKPTNSTEKITMVSQYSQAWFGTHQYSTNHDSSYYYEFPLTYHRLQLIIVTYDEKSGEGKFYLRPFSVSTGMLSAFKNNGEYGGFGEITAINTTMR